jgi:serine protease Do
MAPRGAPQSFADLAAKLQPAVVYISTRQRVAVRRQADPFEEFFRRFGAPVPSNPQGGQQGPQTRETGSLGSGFLISPDGYIVTNNHLIQSADGTGTVDSVTVTLTNRREYAARIIAATARRPRLAQDRGAESAVRQLGRFDQVPRR